MRRAALYLARVAAVIILEHWAVNKLVDAWEDRYMDSMTRPKP